MSAPAMLGELLRCAAAAAPESVAFVEGERRLSYAEWDWLSDRAAFALWSEGVRPGDVVALLLEPSLDYPIAYLGGAKIGAITAGINPRLAPREIDHVLDDSRCRVLVSDREDFRPERGLLHPSALNRPGGAPPVVEVAPDDPLAIVYTSGTTGLPRGAAFTAGALEAVRRIEVGLDPMHATVGIQAIPMAHMGFMTKIAAFIDRNATAIVMKRWSARAALETIQTERVSMIGGVPTQLELMLRDEAFATMDLRSLRACTIGGAPASPDLIRRIREGFGVPVGVRYSCTELALCTGSRADDRDDIVANTVGRALPEVELVIDHPNAEGVGEIVARSPAMFSGYWHGERGLDEHGFYRTGDLGSLDADGNLHLAGRAKELYIRGGYNVYPLEVENVLARHPKVAVCAVVGVPHQILGEVGVVFVVPSDPAAPPTLDELRASAKDDLATHKLPDTLEVRARLPMTSMHKVDKRALTDLA